MQDKKDHLGKKGETKYFKRQLGGIIKVVDGVNAFYLDPSGKFLPFEDVDTMFLDDVDNFIPVKRKDVSIEVARRQKGQSMNDKLMNDMLNMFGEE